MDIARAKFPGRDIPLGDPCYCLPEHRWKFDVSRVERELDMEWIGLEQSITDLLAQLFDLKDKE